MEMSQEIEIPCEECGPGGGTARIGQTFVSNQLRWYRSISCQNGRHIEEDDIGFPPQHVREQLLKQGGRWKLIVSETSREAAMLIIRPALGLSMEETAAAFRLFPVAYTGTKTEAEWLKARMEASNIASQIIESVET
jgi:hypothetical protein